MTMTFEAFVKGLLEQPTQGPVAALKIQVAIDNAIAPVPTQVWDEVWKIKGVLEQDGMQNDVARIQAWQDRVLELQNQRRVLLQAHLQGLEP